MSPEKETYQEGSESSGINGKASNRGSSLFSLQDLSPTAKTRLRNLQTAFESTKASLDSATDLNQRSNDSGTSRSIYRFGGKSAMTTGSSCLETLRDPKSDWEFVLPRYSDDFVQPGVSPGNVDSSGISSGAPIGVLDRIQPRRLSEIDRWAVGKFDADSLYHSASSIATVGSDGKAIELDGDDSDAGVTLQNASYDADDEDNDIPPQYLLSDVEREQRRYEPILSDYVHVSNDAADSSDEFMSTGSTILVTSDSDEEVQIKKEVQDTPVKSSSLKNIASTLSFVKTPTSKNTGIELTALSSTPKSRKSSSTIWVTPASADATAPTPSYELIMPDLREVNAAYEKLKLSMTITNNPSSSKPSPADRIPASKSPPVTHLSASPDLTSSAVSAVSGLSGLSDISSALSWELDYAIDFHAERPTTTRMTRGGVSILDDIPQYKMRAFGHRSAIFQHPAGLKAAIRCGLMRLDAAAAAGAAEQTSDDNEGKWKHRGL